MILSMTSEYDISVDADEPLQVVSFVPDRKPNKSFNAVDAAEREVASFTLGKGKADWGPLTIYAVMKSGDVYAVCPYMPKNAYDALYSGRVSSDCHLQINTFVIHPRPRVFRGGQARIPFPKPLITITIIVNYLLLSTQIH